MRREIKLYKSTSVTLAPAGAYNQNIEKLGVYLYNNRDNILNNNLPETTNGGDVLREHPLKMELYKDIQDNGGNISNFIKNVDDKKIFSPEKLNEE